jgi:hypothetical protein
MNWVLRGKFHILSLGFLLLTFLFLTKVITKFIVFSPNVVALGMALVGLTVIYVQQRLDAKEYAHHKPNTLLNWLKSFPTKKAAIDLGVANITVETELKGRISFSMASDATTDQKINFLLEQVRAHQNVISNISDNIDKLKSSNNAEHKSLQQEIGDLSTSFKKVIAGHIVGSYDVNLLGIILTLCGTLIQFFCVIAD